MSGSTGKSRSRRSEGKGVLAAALVFSVLVAPEVWGALPNLLMGFGPLWDVEYDPAGRYLITRSEYRTLLWDAETATVVRDLTESGATNDVRILFSADGSKYVTWHSRTNQGRIKLWETATSQLIQESDYAYPGYSIPVVRLCGDQVFGYEVNDSGVTVRSFPSGEVLPADGSTSRGVCEGGVSSWGGLSPDGRYIATSTQVNLLRVWDVEHDRVVYETEEHGLAQSFAFAPDSRHFYSWSVTDFPKYEYKITEWDVGTSQPLRKLYGFQNSLGSLVVSPTGKTLLANSYDQILYVWDLQTGLIRNMIAIGAGNLRFGAGGSRFLYTSSGGRITIRDEHSFQVLQDFTYPSGPVVALHQIEPGGQLVTASNNRLDVWNLDTGKFMRRISTPFTGIQNMVVLPDEQTAIVAASAPDPSLNRVDLLSGATTSNYIPWDDRALSMAASPTGEYFAASPISSPHIYLWDLRTRSLYEVLGGGLAADTSIQDIAFSPDGDSIFGVSDQGNVYRWDLPTTTVAHQYLVNEGADFDCHLAVSPDGVYLSTTVGGMSTVWDVSSGDILKQTGPLSASILTTFAPDDSVCYVNFSQYYSHINILKAKTWATSRSYDETIGAYATCLTFSGDGAIVGVGFGDGTIRTWWTGLVPWTEPTPSPSPTLTPSPTPSLTPSPTPSPTPAPVVSTVARYDFRASTDNWQFVSTPEFDAPAPGFVAGDPGLLTLKATNNTSTFGYWESPAVDLAPQNQLYTAKFFVRSPETDRARTPQLRLRVTEEGGQQSAFMTVESRNDGAVSPVADGTTYTLVFSMDLPFDAGFGARPLASTATSFQDQIRLGFDLLNFDPLDDPEGELDLDRVVLTRHDLSDFPTTTTLLKTYTFENGTEGWTSHGAAPFETPSFGAESGGLTVTGLPIAHGTPQVFGFWSSPSGDIPDPLFSGRALYIARFQVASNVPAEDAARVPQFRVRLNDGSFHSASVVAVESTGDGMRSPTAGNPGTYTVFFLPPESTASTRWGATTGADLLASFDYLDFNLEDDPLATLSLQQVDIEAVPYPW